MPLGFEAGDTTLMDPPVQVEQSTRTRMAEIITAVTLGKTPEEITEYMQDDEFPAEVVEMLDRPLERQELNAHVDLLLVAIQSSSLAQAA